MADSYELRGWSNRVPVIRPPIESSHLIEQFWAVRAFIGGIDAERPMNMSDIEMWQRHSHYALEDWERKALFEMDRALRRGYHNSVKFHMKRHAGKKKNG